MRIAVLLLVVAGSAHAQTLTQRIQQCYTIAEVRDRKACVDAVMAGPTADPNRTWWIATKSVDSISDARECTVSAFTASFPGNLQVFYVAGKPPRVAIVAQPYPGDPAFVRIDENKAIRSPDGVLFGPESSRTVIAQLRAGLSVRTRFNDWPSRAGVDNVMDVARIDEPLDDCEAYVSGAE